MTLIEQIDATQFLKPGWNGDQEFPAKAINDETRSLAKIVSSVLNNHWKVGPYVDGSILFSSDNNKIMVAAQSGKPPIISEHSPPDSGGAFVSTIANCCSSMMAGSL